MARIAGINLTKEKRIEAALLQIYGIGRSLAKNILLLAKVDFDKKVGDLSEDELDNIRTVLQKYHTEGEARRIVATNIKRLQDIGSHRGYRHRRKLPLRGQRTKTNTRTVRGNVRRTMGSGRKSSNEKT